MLGIIVLYRLWFDMYIRFPKYARYIVIKNKVLLIYISLLLELLKYDINKYFSTDMCRSGNHWSVGRILTWKCLPILFIPLG